jgi:arylsulfatase A-like enzyme
MYGVSGYLSDAELDHLRAHYAGEVTLVDKWLGAFLDRARDLGMLDDTVLILTSDHGHQLGEHGMIGKIPLGLWYELVDVPMMLRCLTGQAAPV